MENVNLVAMLVKFVILAFVSVIKVNVLELQVLIMVVIIHALLMKFVRTVIVSNQDSYNKIENV